MSTCPQVGSIFNEGIWNAQKQTWEGSANPQTMEGDEAHYTSFLLGTPSLQAVGCSTQLHTLTCRGLCTGGRGRKCRARAGMPWR